MLPDMIDMSLPGLVHNPQEVHSNTDIPECTMVYINVAE